MLTDPVADMLTRIRNGTMARKATIDMPWSRHKEAIAKVLVEEGYLESAAGADVEGDATRRTLRIALRYDDHRRPVINGVKRVSRPSLRVYVGAGEIPAIRRGLGVNVLSTPKGVLVDREARKQGVGGELLCTVW
jgi:small subunit ribosomal protein S8